MRYKSIFLFTSGMAESEEAAGPLPEKSDISQVINALTNGSFT